jgi:hypothetical protein
MQLAKKDCRISVRAVDNFSAHGFFGRHTEHRPLSRAPGLTAYRQAMARNRLGAGRRVTAPPGANRLSCW